MINYYDVLNVSNNASRKEIKKAYKRESIKWHPDKNSSPGATERMILINEAWLILSDIEARSKYDTELELYNSFIRSRTTSDANAYVFNDETLYKWMKNAKQQAKELAKSSLDDLVGMSKAGASAFFHRTKYALLIYVAIVLGVILLK